MGSARPWPSYKLVYRLIIADEHRVVAEGIQQLLMSISDSIHIVGSGEELVEEVRRNPPSVVVSEIKMPGMGGIDAMRILRGEGYNIPFIFLTMHDKPATAVAAVRAGARAFVSKCSACDELIEALETVVQGRFHVGSSLSAGMIKPRYWRKVELTGNRLRVLQLVAAGHGTKRISQELGLSVRTVESHKYWLMRELEVHTTLQLRRKAEEEGLI